MSEVISITLGPDYYAHYNQAFEAQFETNNVYFLEQYSTTGGKAGIIVTIAIGIGVNLLYDVAKATAVKISNIISEEKKDAPNKQTTKNSSEESLNRELQSEQKPQAVIRMRANGIEIDYRFPVESPEMIEKVPKELLDKIIKQRHSDTKRISINTNINVVNYYDVDGMQIEKVPMVQPE